MNSPDHARRELDSVVISIELTLVSIIQGVALFFLTDKTRALLSLKHADVFVYVAAGLCVIFIFWSRSVIHTLTLIRWPLEVRTQLFLHRLRPGRSDSFQQPQQPARLVSTQCHLLSDRLAAFHLRHATDPRAHRRVTRWFRGRPLRPREVRSVAQHPIACSAARFIQSRLRTRHLALA